MFHFCNYYRNKKKKKETSSLHTKKIAWEGKLLPEYPNTSGDNKGLEIYCVKNGKHILLCLGCFLTNEPREGVRNEEPVKKYRVISPRNEPARTFSRSCSLLAAIFARWLYFWDGYRGTLLLQCRLSWLLLLLCSNCSSHTLKDFSFSLKILLLLLSIKITSLPPAALSLLPLPVEWFVYILVFLSSFLASLVSLIKQIRMLSPPSCTLLLLLILLFPLASLSFPFSHFSHAYLVISAFLTFLLSLFDWSDLLNSLCSLQNLTQ